MSYPKKPSRPPGLVPAGLLACVVAAPLAARAQTVEHRLVENLELGIGSMLSRHQREALGYGLGIQASARAGLLVLDKLTLRFVVSTWWFPSDTGYGRATLFGAGLRGEPWVRGKRRLFIDGHTGGAWTGDLIRFMFDFGVGLEVDLSRRLGAGPVLRYGHLVTASDAAPADAKFWSLGLSFTLRPPPPPAFPVLPPPPGPPVPEPPPPPQPDSDGDGVPDNLDICSEPAGRSPDPDPARAGCPLGDADGDQVLDNVDRCPNVIQGPTPDPERPGCPDVDEDGDGLVNHLDSCPAEPASLQPDPARPGCSLPDRDRDAVPDSADACPDRAGAPSGDAGRGGCPGLVLVETRQIKIGQPIQFATGTDRISASSNAVLRAVADALLATPAIRRISVEGHTGATGDPEKNLALSRRRAESVVAWLVKNGVDASRLEARGLGDREPLKPQDTIEGRAANWRVQFLIVDPAPRSDALPAPAPTPSPADQRPAAPRAPLKPAPPAPAPGDMGK